MASTRSSTADSASAFVTATVSYNRRDILLYALGIGCSDLRHVYEEAEGFAAFPLFPAVLLHKGTSSDVIEFPSPTLLRMASFDASALPGTRALLDAERYIERVRDIPSSEGTHHLTYRSWLLGVSPKRNGALVHTEGELLDREGKVLYRMKASAYALGATGVSPSGRELPKAPTPPTRPCDAWHVERVGAQQAQLYRLSGDYNPLHIDPSVAQLQGFDQPILHGLCTLGFAVRAVLRLCACDDPTRFQAVRARFVGTVAPGDLVCTKVWAEARRVFFITEVMHSSPRDHDPEEAKLVIGHAYVELTTDAELGELVPRQPAARL